VVQNHDTVGLNGTEDTVASTPSQVGNGLLASLERRQSLPAFIVGGACSTHHFALPHYNETVFGASAQNALFWVVADGVDLVIKELALEGRLVDRQVVVLVMLDVEETDDALT